METRFIREVSARYSNTRRQKFAISDGSDVVRFIRTKVIKDNTKEHFIILSLDSARNVASYSVVSVGTTNFSIVHPREVFQMAILSGAIGIIVAHNHPSGRAKPSYADRQVTKRLKQAGEILGIRVLDHVIVTEDDYHSFQEEGEF
jgi:DNA repair protein RadC